MPGRGVAAGGLVPSRILPASGRTCAIVKLQLAARTRATQRRADDDFRIDVMNVPAIAANLAFPIVSRRNAAFNLPGTALAAEFDRHEGKGKKCGPDRLCTRRDAEALFDARYGSMRVLVSG